MNDVRDAERLAALASYDILDTPAEQGFDDVVHLARQLCGAPIAQVSLVAMDRQLFKVRMGLPLCEMGLDSSVCVHVLDEPDLLVISDLIRDPRTAHNPLVTGEPYIRFYAGAPLRTEAGMVLGTLCVIDTVARPTGLTDPEAAGLRRLARQVVGLLEYRTSLRQREDALLRQETMLRQHRVLLDTRHAVTDAAGDYDAVLQALVAGAMAALPQAEGGVVELRDGDALVYRSPQGVLNGHAGVRMPLRGSLAGRCALSGQAMRIADVREEEGVSQETLERLGVRSCLLVPVWRLSKVVGVLKLQASRTDAFSDDDLQMARLFGGEATIELAEIGEMSARKAAYVSENRYHSVFNSIVDFAIIVTNRRGKVTEWNSGAEHILGWTQAEMRGHDVDRIFTPEDRTIAQPETEMHLSLEQGRASDERWHLRRDGTPFWASGEMMPLRDEDGTHRGFVKVLRDRTAEHEAGEALRESEARFRAFAQAVPNHIWSATPDGRVDWANEPTYAYSGQPTDGTIGQVWTERIHEDDLPGAEARLASALASGDTYETEFRLRRADGAYRWFLARALPIRGLDGVVERWIGANTDVHDQRIAIEALAQLNATLEQRVGEREAALRDSIDFARLALSAVNGVGVWTYDVSSDLFFCDAAISELYGLDPEQAKAGIPRSGFLANVHPTDMGQLAVTMADGLTQPGDLELEYRIVHPDGSTRWVLSRGHTYADEAGQPLRRTGVGIETTKQHLIEEQLRQSQKMEAVGQLTGGLAHDFNNLLTGISGSLDILQRRVEQGRISDLDRYIVMAQGASKRAASLTHRLLAFSRRQTLDPRPTNVAKLIHGMEDLIRRTVGPEITVETVDMVGLWTTLVDPSQLENALLNLCINARDAMPDGGRLTIETGNRWMDDRAARERDVPPGQYLSLCVSDTGTGMPPNVIARAFEPFFTTKPLGLGTGLGLSMIYGFARQSGGQVRIYSEIGQGSMVCLYLPRHYGAEEVAENQSNRGEVPRAEVGETVLVVDDEAAIRMLVGDVLSDFGYASIEAEDGASGLKVLRSEIRVDLLVTDVGLPGGMNGRQVADAARVLRPGLKVLFITGYAENAVVGNGHLDPGMAVLSKPFAMDDLAAKIRNLIEEPKHL